VNVELNGDQIGDDEELPLVAGTRSALWPRTQAA